MQRVNRVVGIVMVGMLMSSCAKETLIKQAAMGDPASVEIEANERAGDNRFVMQNQEIPTVTDGTRAANIPGNVGWRLIAELSSPNFMGRTLSATHVTLNGDMAYVAYKNEGQGTFSVIEAIDLSDTQRPQVVNRLDLPSSLVNSIEVQEAANGNPDRLWLALSDSQHGGMPVAVDLAPNGALTTDITAQLMSRDGGAAPSEATSITTTSPDKTRFASLVAGADARILIGDPATMTILKTIEIPAIVQDGDAEITFDEGNPTTVLVAAGSDGVQAYDIKSGSLVNSSPDLLVQRGSSSGVTTDEDFVYMANGSDGLAICKSSSLIGVDLQPVVIFNPKSFAAPATHVAVDGEWVFLANGEAGLSVIRQHTGTLEGLRK